MNDKLPLNFEDFTEQRKAGFLRVKKVKEEGGHVAGTFCTYTPVEILDAAGFTPVSLCGMSAETIPDAEVHLPKNLCPLVKSSYGFAVSDKCPYTYFADLIVAETTCDAKKKMYELLNKIKPTYVLHLPQGLAGEAREAWRKELYRFKAYLEDTFGVEITDEALRKASKERNEERRAKLDLMELQKNEPPMLKGLDMYTTLEGSGFLFESEQRLASLRGLEKKVKDEYAEGKNLISKNEKRILVTGCPIGGVLQKTVKAIEESGGVVVCFENCTGIKAIRKQVDVEAEDIIGAIADRYIDIGCAVMTPDPNRMELLKELIAEYNIEGVIEIDLQACTPYCVEAFTISALMKEIGMPYMAIETDYSTSDSGQLLTRIEAFLERL